MQYRNNPLAPPWMWSGSYCDPAGHQDEYFIYALVKPLAASESVVSQPFLFDGDGCFLWRVSASASVPTTGVPPIYLAWRDQLGRQLSNQLLAIGVRQNPQVPIEQIEPGARWTYDAVNTNTDPGIAYYALIGVKRRKVA